MAKDPAFLFYPDDWLGGTMNLNLIEKGCYFELLILQFHVGSFSQEEAKVVLGKYFKKVWPKIEKKFTFSNDKYFNQRLADEISRRRSYNASRRNNASKKSVKEEHMHNHMPMHMGNGNGISNNNKGVTSKINFIPPAVDEVKDYFKAKGYKAEIAQKAFDYYEAAGWIDSKGNKVRNWKQKMIANWFRPEHLTTISNENANSRLKEVWT